MKTFLSVLLAALFVLALMVSSAFADPPTNDQQPDPTRTKVPLEDLRGAATYGVIVFTSSRDGDFELFTMDADGGNPRQLTDNNFGDWDPVWSPDGTRIAFFRDFGNDVLEVGVIDAATGEEIFLTDMGGFSLDINWTPDGEHLIFCSDIEGNFELYIINADGENLRQITDTAINERLPVVAPDGTRLVYQSGDSNWDLFIAEFDAAEGTVGEPQPLTETPDNERIPAWSPDSTLLTYTSDRGGDTEIFVMAVDGLEPGEQMQLTDNDASDAFSKFSPDARQIVFETDRDGDFEIYSMDADGDNQTRLTDDLGDDFAPDWR